MLRLICRPQAHGKKIYNTLLPYAAAIRGINMALQPAADTTAESNSTAITRPVLDSLIIDVIALAIVAQSDKTDADERVIRLTLVATMNAAGQAQVIQEDETKVFLTDIVDALTSSTAGYRVAYKYIRGAREGKKDKIKLQVAWS